MNNEKPTPDYTNGLCARCEICGNSRNTHSRKQQKKCSDERRRINKKNV